MRRGPREHLEGLWQHVEGTWWAAEGELAPNGHHKCNVEVHWAARGWLRGRIGHQLGSTSATWRPTRQDKSNLAPTWGSTRQHLGGSGTQTWQHKCNLEANSAGQVQLG